MKTLKSPFEINWPLSFPIFIFIANQVPFFGMSLKKLENRYKVEYIPIAETLI